MPDIHPITLPKWGLEMTEGTVVAWHVEEGALIEKGVELCDIETEKIVNTLDAERAGVLRRRLGAVGEALPVGALIGVVAAAEIAEADIDSFIASFGSASSAASESAPASPSAEELRARNENAHASPLARRLANQLGVDLSGVTGTGRGGRISQEDVEAAGGGGSDPVPSEDVHVPAKPPTAPSTGFTPFSGMRRAIGQALVRAKQTVPHFYVSVDVGMDEINGFRARLNARPNAAAKVSVNDFVLKAAAAALGEVPEVNVHVTDEGVQPMARADIAVAVAIDNGLLTPVIRDVAAKDIQAVAREVVDLAERARARTLAQADLEGAGFTVSNLGMFGVRQFDAIVNPPQAAILAVGATRREAVEGEGGKVAFRSVMTATLSCDHRAVDGATAARFLAAFRRGMEDPLTLLL